TNVQIDKKWAELSELLKTVFTLKNSELLEGKVDHNPALEQLLDDVIPLFFQFWADNGQVSAEMYPKYIVLAKICHRLSKAQETGLFTQELLDYETLEIQSIAQIVESLNHQCQTGTCYRQGIRLMEAKLTHAVTLLQRLQDELNAISPALQPIHHKLVDLKQQLETLLRRGGPSAFALSEVEFIQDQVREIDSARIDGKYLAIDGTVVPGQAAVIELLESCFEDIHELLASREPVDGENELRPVYEDLIRIKARLDLMLKYSRWAVRTDDLHPIQKRLGEIDNMRVDGKFMDQQGKIPSGQAVLHFLLSKCYRLVYKIQIENEAVDDDLMPVYNQLLTLSKCLDELLNWSLKLNDTELLPYQMKLSLIDQQRVDGKFVNEKGEVPQGQAILHDLLQKCYDGLGQLK
ncbi:hypothetical protein EDD86DRAFT_178912, partial [Gorgonomyces haynaldii]